MNDLCTVNSQSAAVCHRGLSGGERRSSLHEAPGQEGVMEGFLIRAAVVAVGLWLASKMGLVAFNSTGTLIAAALLLGVVNAFVRPVIIILTLPITFITLGLFLLVINALMLMLVSWFLPGFLVAGFWPAIGAAIVVSLTSWIMSGWIGPRGRVEVMTVRGPRERW
jgi:putative membrane protein